MLLHIDRILGILALWSSPALSKSILPVVGSRSSNTAITFSLLTDPDRLDPFAKDGRLRSIMVSGFSPKAACYNRHPDTYMPPATAAFQDDKFAAYGLPHGTFRSLYLETCDAISSRSKRSSRSLPLVLFSGALGTSRLIYNSMLQSIAAAGYLVLSVDHPYDADLVEYPNGTIITGVNISDSELEFAVATRADDIAFLHRQMMNSSIANKLFPGYLRGDRAPRTAVIGHSFGGAAAAASILQIPSLRGGLNIDGTIFGSVLKTGLDRPFMLMGHENKTQETDPSWKAVWPLLRGWKKEFEVRGAAHYSFSDLPLITSVLGLQSVMPPEVGQVLGTVEGRRMMELTVTYVVAFLDMVLKDERKEILNGDSEEFPEVVQVA
jgi:pimeloyl-ACP methyl ester carboxylesterase